MFVLKDLIKLTPHDILKRSKDIYIHIVKSTIESDKYGIYKKIIGITTSKKKISIKIYNPDTDVKAMYKNCFVWVHCNCEYFTYNLETVLTRHGSSSIIDSNGANPREKNPHGKIHLCKHLVAFVLYGYLKVKPKKIRQEATIPITLLKQPQLPKSLEYLHANAKMIDTPSHKLKPIIIEKKETLKKKETKIHKEIKAKEKIFKKPEIKKNKQPKIEKIKTVYKRSENPRVSKVSEPKEGK